MKKLLVLFIFTPLLLFSETLTNLNNYDFVGRMDFFNVPAVSVSVVDNGEIFQTLSLGEGINNESLFQAAGISKAITSLGIMKLVEAGVLDLDTNVNDYLIDWKVEDTIVTRYRKVTLRMLLSHTSGIHESILRGYDRGEELPEITETIPQPRYYPGLKRRYSWSGFTVIQQIIEDVTGESFIDYMNREVLSPLGMENSSFGEPVTEEQAVKGHDLFGNEIPGEWRFYPQLASMGLWSTTEDISRYILELERVYNGETGIISKETLNEMLTYQTTGWGLGISLAGSDENLIFRHSGESVGYISRFIARPDKGDGFVIMCSGENSWKLINEVIHYLGL